mmetsp:Transcript_53422/g.61685  ORF Transcript_53422/g.61685 Transcript_53422/m.61685 type:complete len:137 (+) Transcript_53422:316-726(+)
MATTTTTTKETATTLISSSSQRMVTENNISQSPESESESESVLKTENIIPKTSLVSIMAALIGFFVITESPEASNAVFIEATIAIISTTTTTAITTTATTTTTIASSSVVASALFAYGHSFFYWDYWYINDRTLDT